jgi:hypothetical protein
MSPGRRPHRGTGVSWTFQATVVLLYALAVGLMPLAHHDVVCHAKSPTHCTTCVVGASAEAAGDAAGAARCSLDDLGIADSYAHIPSDPITLGAPAGRAPPTA